MRRLLLLVAAGGLTLAACGADGNDGPGATSATTMVGPADTAAGGAAVPEALRFSAPTVGGGTLDMARFAGRTVAYWFWAPT
ncbi:MAG: hypothetical protein ACOYMR_18085 [Ilumatobacteraceae bacterium]|jgi:hypothetical protein